MLGQHRFGAGSLQRQEGTVFQMLDADIWLKHGAQVFYIRICTGGVDHHENMVAPIGKHQVILDAALRVREQPIALPPGLQSMHIHRDEPLKGRGGGRIGGAAQDDLPHMADIKKPGFGAGMYMLLHHPQWILDRHIIAGKANHFCPQCSVQIIKWRLPKSMRHCRLMCSGRKYLS